MGGEHEVRAGSVELGGPGDIAQAGILIAVSIRLCDSQRSQVYERGEGTRGRQTGRQTGQTEDRQTKEEYTDKRTDRRNSDR